MTDTNTPHPVRPHTPGGGEICACGHPSSDHRDFERWGCTACLSEFTSWKRNGKCDGWRPVESPSAPAPADAGEVEDKALGEIDRYLAWRESHLRGMGSAYSEDAALVAAQLAAFRSLRSGHNALAARAREAEGLREEIAAREASSARWREIVASNEAQFIEARDHAEARWKKATAKVAEMRERLASVNEHAEWTARTADEHIDELRARCERLEGALRWVNGETDEWPGERPENSGPYFWRRTMMQRAGLDPLRTDTARAAETGGGA